MRAVGSRYHLIIFWGSNPVESHPRHWERYSVFPAGQLVPDGRADRFLVVADVRPTPSTEAADLLHLHRNTVLYRLSRIEDLLGVDLRNAEVRLGLHLALKIGEILES